MLSILDREFNRSQKGINLLFKFSQYLVVLTKYAKSMNKIKNYAEERESKMSILLKIAKNSDLTELESKGLPLMMAIRKLGIQI